MEEVGEKWSGLDENFESRQDHREIKFLKKPRWVADITSNSALPISELKENLRTGESGRKKKTKDFVKSLISTVPKTGKSYQC